MEFHITDRLASIMFRSFSIAVIIIVCATGIVFASSKYKGYTCGENEVLSRCVNRACGYRKCSEVGGPIECIMTSIINCKKGCICRNDYLRADNGTCILASQCPNALRCPKLNEYYDPCPPQCPSRTCADTNRTTECPEHDTLQVGDPKCPPGSCRCNVGFYRDSNRNCVTWNLCNPGNATVCGANEVYDTCIAPCPRRRCDVDDSLIRCAEPPQPGDPTCTAGCRCADNLFRNNERKCVPRSECPLLCGPNEVYSTCVRQCQQQRCDSNSKVVSFPAKQECQAGCQSIGNYLRNQLGFCVPRSQCEKNPLPPVKRPNTPN